ncbi:hypothetical protein HOY82DRAFT_548788, partial [Tuber indicum]
MYISPPYLLSFIFHLLVHLFAVGAGLFFNTFLSWPVLWIWKGGILGVVVVAV